MEQFKDSQRYDYIEAESEAFWLKCIIDGDLAPDYDAAEEMWNSDTLMEDTKENELFWSTVVGIYNEQSNAYREELDEKRIDAITGSYCGCEHEHHQENPELINENIHQCFVCQKELEPVFPNQFKKGSVQYNNALIVNMAGGYSMFVDPFPQEWLFEEDRLDTSDWVKKGRLDQCTAIICHDCAHDLCEKVSWINTLIEPKNTHSHRIDMDWTGHTGWDLPHPKIIIENENDSAK
ncbi:MAG: hypothetical protein WCP03_00155 [Candidatus Saccharibacteria bacterium]